MHYKTFVKLYPGTSVWDFTLSTLGMSLFVRRAKKLVKILQARLNALQLSENHKENRDSEGGKRLIIDVKIFKNFPNNDSLSFCSLWEEMWNIMVKNIRSGARMLLYSLIVVWTLAGYFISLFLSLCICTMRIRRIMMINVDDNDDNIFILLDCYRN